MKKFILLTIFSAIFSQPEIAKGNDVILKGTISVSNNYVEIVIINESKTGVFIKDFWQSFSSGRFVRINKGQKSEKSFTSVSGLIEEDVFFRGRHWINIPPNSDDKDDEFASVYNNVRLRIPVSEIIEKSVLKGSFEDRIEMDIKYAIKGIKTPSQKDWKNCQVSFKFINDSFKKNSP